MGKTPIAGVRDRATGKVSTEVVESTDKATLQGFVMRHTTQGTKVYTDEASAYQGIPRPHESVKHLHRYTMEFEGRHNARPMDTAEQMGIMARGASGKRMTYQNLIGAA